MEANLSYFHQFTQSCYRNVLDRNHFYESNAFIKLILVWYAKKKKKIRKFPLFDFSAAYF